MTTATQALHDFDMRQRFYFEKSPVRGDVVRINDSLQTILQQKDYPVALQKLLGEMLVAASLPSSSAISSLIRLSVRRRIPHISGKTVYPALSAASFGLPQ